MSTQLRVRHTADLRAGELDAVRDLLFACFGDELTEDDVEHGLGGMHAMVYDGDRLIAHGSVVLRRLLLTTPGPAPLILRTGYVEAVVVAADRRRQGHAGTVMTELERIVRAAYDVGALAATDEGVLLYAPRGWRLWTGTSSVLAPESRRRTPEDDGGIYLLGVAGGPEVTPGPDGAGDLACDWRGGDVW